MGGDYSTRRICRHRENMKTRHRRKMLLFKTLFWLFYFHNVGNEQIIIQKNISKTIHGIVQTLTVCFYCFVSWQLFLNSDDKGVKAVVENNNYNAPFILTWFLKMLRMSSPSLIHQL